MQATATIKAGKPKRDHEPHPTPRSRHEIKRATSLSATLWAEACRQKSCSESPRRTKELVTVIHSVRDGEIVEYWSVTDVARVLQQLGALSGPPT
jgi:hypothetical protein